MSTVVEAPSHGFVDGDEIVFTNLEGGDGITEGVKYYVIADGLTTDEFQFSDALGGVAFAFTAITAGTVAKWPTYSVVTSGPMIEPEPPDTPDAPSVTSSAVVQIDGTTTVVLTVTPDPGGAEDTIRNVEIQYTTVAGPDFTNAPSVTIPVTTAKWQLPNAYGLTNYYVRTRNIDVFGNASWWSDPTTHTTAADTTGPATPTGLSLTVGPEGVTIMWTANTEDDIAGYEVATAATSGGTYTSLGYTTSTFKWVRAVSDTIIWFKVRAFDRSGNFSAYTAPQGATPDQVSKVKNSVASVIVDSTGLTVKDGALTIQDEFGKTVMVASGFSGNWQDYVRLGLYNCGFLSGTVGTIANGRTTALPYWTVSNSSGTPTLEFVSGGGIKFTPSALNSAKKIVSDAVAVRPAAEYAVPLSFKATVAAGLLQVQATVFWYKSDGTTAASTASEDLQAAATSGTISETNFDVGVVTAPADARFAKLQLVISEILSHNASNNLTISATGLLEAPPRNLMNTGTPLTRFYDDVEVTDLTVDGELTAAIAKGSGSTIGQTGITTETDLTGSSVTFTAVAGASYLVLFSGFASSTVADDVCVWKLNEGASTMTNFAASLSFANRANGGASFYIASGLSAGSHTFKLRALRNNGTGTLTVSASIAVLKVG